MWHMSSRVNLHHYPGGRPRSTKVRTCHDQHHRSFRGGYLRYKALAEAAIAQVDEAALCATDAAGSNSIAVICWHISGNLQSRFTDFLTTDGEKPWRHRDEEFDERSVTREALLEKWNAGWSVLLQTLETLADDQVHARVTIRGRRSAFTRP